MLRLLLPIAVLIALFGWVLFRLLIKKDLKKNLNSLFFVVFFAAVWLLLYFFISKA